MLRKTLIIFGVILCALVVGAQAQSSATFTGKVSTTASQVVAGKFAIVLKLAEYPDKAFLIDLQDAPKFGLTRDTEIKSGDEFSQFMGAADALKGKTVKLTCVKWENGGPQDLRVTALERLTK